MDAVAERTFSSVVRDIGGNVDRLVRAELECAVADLRDGMESAAEASRYVVVAAAFATLAAAFILLGGMFALSILMPMWLASLVVGVVAGLAALTFLSVGRAHIARHRSPPAGDARPSLKVAA